MLKIIWKRQTSTDEWLIRKWNTWSDRAACSQGMLDGRKGTNRWTIPDRPADRTKQIKISNHNDDPRSMRKIWINRNESKNELNGSYNRAIVLVGKYLNLSCVWVSALRSWCRSPFHVLSIWMHSFDRLFDCSMIVWRCGSSIFYLFRQISNMCCGCSMVLCFHASADKRLFIRWFVCSVESGRSSHSASSLWFSIHFFSAHLFRCRLF